MLAQLSDFKPDPDSDTPLYMQLANQLWHTDSSFKRVPGKISFLSAHELPSTGGETEFADLRAAYPDRACTAHATAVSPWPAYVEISLSSIRARASPSA